MHVWPSDWVSLIADAGSILGFFATIWLALATKRLKTHYQRLIALTRGSVSLQKHCAALDVLLTEYTSSKTAIGREISRAAGTLKSLQKDLPESDTDSITAILNLIQNNQRKLTQAGTEQIFNGLVAVTVEMESTLERQKLT